MRRQIDLLLSLGLRHTGASIVEVLDCMRLCENRKVKISNTTACPHFVSGLSFVITTDICYGRYEVFLEKNIFLLSRYDSIIGVTITSHKCVVFSGYINLVGVYRSYLFISIDKNERRLVACSRKPSCFIRIRSFLVV